jgi:folate-binding protein YgfZ
MSTTDTAGELHAFRRRHERGTLRVTGGDRVEWLNGLLTNDLKSREGPRACPALWLTPQGRMIADLVVLELGTETWLDVPASLAATLAERLDRMIFAEDARVADASSELTSTAVYGLEAIALLREAIGQGSTDGAAADPGALAIGHAQDDGVVVHTHAIGSGLPGVHVYQTPASAQGFEDARLAGRRRLDDREATVLRVERGIPEFLVDTGEETIPLEAGLDDMISHTKGCYVGQEIIVRIRDRAHGRVARKLVGLSFQGGVVPHVPQGVTGDGRHAGRVTSAVMSAAVGHPIALATLLRDFTEPGTSVALEDGTPAVVSALPFVG